MLSRKWRRRLKNLARKKHATFNLASPRTTFFHKGASELFNCYNHAVSNVSINPLIVALFLLESGTHLHHDPDHVSQAIGTISYRDLVRTIGIVVRECFSVSCDYGFIHLTRMEIKHSLSHEINVDVATLASTINNRGCLADMEKL
ncbi:hypothetical protein R6Q57_009419 [Mikania cordata]